MSDSTTLSDYEWLQKHLHSTGMVLTSGEFDSFILKRRVHHKQDDRWIVCKQSNRIGEIRAWFEGFTEIRYEGEFNAR